MGIEKNMRSGQEKRAWKIAIGVITLIIFVVLLMYMKSHTKEGLQDLQAREIFGSTVEERLMNRGFDVTNARITLIDDVDSLKKEYSGIFKDAKDGHYLVELPNSIIVYDFEHDVIIAQFDFMQVALP
jgi:hypothetical protein